MRSHKNHFNQCSRGSLCAERKINSVYAAYGKEQARVVGEVLGLVVHNYILVDMYVLGI